MSEVQHSGLYKHIDWIISSLENDGYESVDQQYILETLADINVTSGLRDGQAYVLTHQILTAWLDAGERA